MATYVLVHGGGHGGWCYQRVARLLRAAGHEACTPALTGLGERAHALSPAVDLDFHIRDVTAVLHYEDLHDVILVGSASSSRSRSPTRTRCGPSPSTTSCAPRPCPPAIPSSSPRPARQDGGGRSTPATT